MSMKVAVILNGCGHRDGSEIQEAVFTLLALSELGAEAVCFAPNEAQVQTIDHVNGKPMSEKRNMLHEAARIARGNIHVLAEARIADFDALIIPGGSGTARNLCSYATEGANMSVHPQVANLITDAFRAHKPIGAVCIAPVLIAKVLGDHGVQLTLGNDPGVASHVEAMGAHHVVCSSKECVVDLKHRIVSTPAYMYGDANIADVCAGIRKLVHEVLNLI